MKGRIHSFESLGAVDGPGVRFVVFMQGCFLQCKYCQNRDTWNLNAGKEYESDEIVEKILRYKNYKPYSRSINCSKSFKRMYFSKFTFHNYFSNH